MNSVTLTIVQEVHATPSTVYMLSDRELSQLFLDLSRCSVPFGDPWAEAMGDACREEMAKRFLRRNIGDNIDIGFWTRQSRHIVFDRDQATQGAAAVDAFFSGGAK